MSALTRLVRERCSSWSLVPGALFAIAVSTPARAQCGDEVVLKYLDSGTEAPVLITPRGAPVIGGDFSFRVFEAPPLSTGFLIYSGFDDPVFNPSFGATIWTTTPFFSKSFGTNALGRSGPLFFASVVTDDLCGAQATFQALVMGGSSPSGFAVTNAMRLRVGVVTQSPLAYDALATDGTETPAGPLSLGDMDEDGIRDLVSVSSAASGDNTAWVRPGLASGGFGAEQKTTLASGVSSHLVPYAELADFNGDGHLDLVRKTGTGLAFAFGNGAGGFLGEFTVGLSSNLSRADAADLNNDGHLDVAAAHQGGPESSNKDVSVLLGTNLGFFSFPVSYVAAVTPHLGVGADVGSADLDEDGDLDLVVAIALWGPGPEHSFQSSVLEGAGNGTFGSPVSYADTTAPSSTSNRVVSLELADFDGDTFVDVATTYAVNSRLYARLGNGDLTLGPVAEYVVGGADPYEIAVADLDDDAIVDLLTRNTSTADVSVLLGLGDGTFASGGTFGVFLNSRGLAVDDVDLDGRQDLLATAENQILQVSGNGDGTFAGAPRHIFGRNLVVIADFDGNGANDVVTGTEGPTGLVFHPYPFGPATTVSSLDVFDARAAHVNGDAFIDLVVNQFIGGITVLPGLGDGTFGPKLDAFTGSPFALADFDGDQVLDLAARKTQAGISSIQVAHGNGDGTFAAPVTHTIASSAGNNFAVGDVDGNTTQDLVYEVSVAGPDMISMRPGNGDGTFGAEETLVTNGSSSSAGGPYLVDFGNDGDLDIVVVGLTLMRIFVNDGTGSFALKQTLTAPSSDLAFADMDGDGDMDVVGRSSSFGYLLLWEEPGGLGPATQFPLAVQSHAMAVGDLDRDGMPDLAVADFVVGGFGRLSIRYNQVGE